LSDALEDLARANKLVSWFCGARALFEPRYEDSALFRYIAHSHACARSRRNTGKATDRRREAARSGDAEGALPMHIWQLRPAAICI